MGLCAMVTVDLRGLRVGDGKRDKFNECMEKKQWCKAETVSTTWWAQFAEGATEAGVISETKEDVRNCARYAAISDWDAVVEVGTSRPAEFGA